MLRSLKARMTLWFAVLFAVLSLAAFTFTYYKLTSSLSRRIDKLLAIEVQEMVQIIDTSGAGEVTRQFLLEAKEEGTGRVYYRLFSPRGRLLAASDLSTWGRLGGPPENTPAAGQSILRTVSVPGKPFRMREVSYGLRDGDLLQIGLSLKDDELILLKFRESFGSAFALMLASGVFIAYFMARRAMSGVERIRHLAGRIERGDFSQRVSPEGEGEEIENLARAFNRMQERLQLLIRELREVTNNIAHDLRSPITAIRGMAETTLSGRQDLGDYQEMAANVIEESDRLVIMISTMLEIAETDAGMRPISHLPVDLATIVRDVEDLFHPVAEDKGISLEIVLGRPSLVVPGDRAKLQRVFANLLDNAIKYTPDGGRVTLAADQTATHAVVTVSDTGIGIRPEDRPRIFDRFFRCDQSRSTAGNGLGLSLVQTIVRAHEGDISVMSTPGRGSSFRVALPLPEDGAQEVSSNRMNGARDSAAP